ncbi:SUR7/PalI family-domain-containing protein [Podospora didyma]|uniref:SUR7/PalI family-domain-containing protein n=1 Tax=Podospora didyma TaxID=330526 RepID=A0AAE0P5J3_9PEZI|nr:SUR7/PalI family-domain-containing protein [Podospora didyma]
MGNFGRVVCVALPFLLTTGALIAMLVAGLAGVADKSLYMFQVNTTNLSVAPNAIKDALGLKGLGLRDPEPQTVPDTSSIINKVGGLTNDGKGNNVTAKDLGLYNLYDVGLWGYCYTTQNGTRDCTKPAFNWAATALNLTTSDVNTLITLSGQNVTIPSGVMDAIHAFGTVTRWAEIVFIIAMVSLGVELFFGFFANCSRAFSCITFLVALVAMVAVCTAAALATAMAVVVVGAVESTAKFYGVGGSFNTKFLAAVWIGAAFAIAAGFFWLFTICCCKPDHSSRKSRSRGGSSEKLNSGRGSQYEPLHEPAGYPQQHYPQQSYAAPQSYGQAYEPYSHTRV